MMVLVFLQSSHVRAVVGQEGQTQLTVAAHCSPLIRMVMGFAMAMTRVPIQVRAIMMQIQQHLVLCL